MTRRTFDKIDTIGGVITVTLGLIASYISKGYSMGSSVAIGPGVFPMILSVLLVLLGAGIILGAQGRATEGSPTINMRAIVCIVGSIVAFALLIGTAGLVLAIFVSVFLARMAEPGNNIFSLIALAGGLSLLCWGVFVFALGLPLTIMNWPF